METVALHIYSLLGNGGGEITVSRGLGHKIGSGQVGALYAPPLSRLPLASP